MSNILHQTSDFKKTGLKDKLVIFLLKLNIIDKKYYICKKYFVLWLVRKFYYYPGQKKFSLQ